MSKLTIDDPAYFARLREVESAHWWSRGMWRLASAWLNAALRGQSGLRALDVGCGTGGTLARLAARAEVAEVVGVDPSREALGWARRHCAHPLALGDARALSFSSGSFDLVTCFDVLQHLPEGSEPEAAAEIARVLRPGGIVIFRANGRGWARPEAGSIRPYRLEQLAERLAEGGLEVRRASYANCLPSLAQELRGRIRGGRGHPERGGLQIRVPGSRRNGMMSAIAAAEAFAAGRLGVRLPFGHSTMVLAIRPWSFVLGPLLLSSHPPSAASHEDDPRAPGLVHS